MKRKNLKIGTGTLLKKSVRDFNITEKITVPYIDEIDRMIAEHYEFTDEELDFIINYDIKYRMGKE